MPTISVYIIAYNEVEKVRLAIESVSWWADEIILVDSHSTDGTAELAAQLGAKVVQVDFKGFGDLRNQALAACTQDWVFSLDADERCTPEAAEEIRRLAAEGALDVYHTPRRNFFMGRWIKHSGWYPNYRQPQLFRRGAMSYDLKPVHEGYVLHSSKPVGHMQSSIWQFPFKNMAEVMHKANRYSSLGAEKIKHKRITMGSALLHAKWAFWKHYLFKLGFLDGWAGFVIAVGNFEGTFYRYVKALEIQKGEAWRSPTKQPLSRHD